MYIVGKIKITKQNRITIGEFLDKKKFPGKIVLTVPIGEEMIEIVSAEKCPHGKQQVVDDKGRIVVPGWILEETGKNSNEFFVIVGDDSRVFLSPKTGNIL